MRIIAGMYRGRTLAAQRDLSIRPTADRVKQTIFDLLSTRIELDGAHVLDLFAGSGSLGLEALSRGAAHATFIEKTRTSLEALEKNIRTLGCENRATAHLADVFWFLRNAHQTYDLVFVDPPYALETIGTLPSVIAGSGVVRKGSFVVMEHSRESEVPVPEDSFEVLRKSFGQTVLLILKAIR